MSDTQLFFIYTTAFFVIGAFARYALGSSLAVLKPYADGELRTYSPRAKRAIWFVRIGYVICISFAGLTYTKMGVFCTVMLFIGYFFTYVIAGSLEEDISNSEILEAASCSQASQINSRG